MTASATTTLLVRPHPLVRLACMLSPLPAAPTHVRYDDGIACHKVCAEHLPDRPW